MCGISGLIDLSRRSSSEELAGLARRMSDCLSHRGPDDEGVWVDAECGIALSHRRLSIIDLTAEGHQPMISADGRFVLIYNGEVYNHRPLRAALEQLGARFHGHSDTEVLLEAIAHWGVRETLQRINGMFGFAVWDRRERRLTLVRDRVGIKPLYYGWAGSTLLFGSELKVLREHPEFRPQIDRNVLALFLENGYIPGACCIFEGVRKLEAGHLLELSSEDSSENPVPECYWSMQAAANKAPRRNISEGELREELRELLKDSVRLRLVADVPVGTFLSGGIDSSLVTSLAAEESRERVRTFTIGFAETEYDESIYAQSVARQLTVNQTIQQVSASEMLDVIPLMPSLYDEPFADPSQIPTYLVSKLARRDVTVCLSGDGGDELFCGYRRYHHIEAIRRKLARLPRPLRKSLARGYDLLRRRSEPGLAHQLASTRSDRELYTLLHRHWKSGSAVVIGGDATQSGFQSEAYWGERESFLENMMFYDCRTYLPEDILCKVDRASMVHALEVRVPLLDHRIVEWSWSIPIEQKTANGVGKLPLRSLLAEHLPRELFERPKTGFGIPLGQWLRGPLRDWAEELLSPERLRQEGWLQPKPVREKWEEHLSGQRDWEYLLWNVLMFQAWLRELT